jgi:hypothetical protein
MYLYRRYSFIWFQEERINLMAQTFVHGDVNQLWQVTNFDERFVYAKKLVDGKTGRGRPSKFNRSEVESLIPGGLVAEVVEDVQPGVEVPQTENDTVVCTQELNEVPPDQVVFVELD